MSVQQTCAAASPLPACLAGLPRARKDEALAFVADALARRAAEILAENAEDLRLARENRLPRRSSIGCCSTRTGWTTWPTSVRALAALPDLSASGRRLAARQRPRTRKVRVPLGVVAVIYEARPNVTVDAACLCLKTGNAVMLRGGSAADAPNRILAEVVQGASSRPACRGGGLVPHRRTAASSFELLEQRRYVDLVIPRGGEDLKDYLVDHSKVPVIYAAGGNCHVYVDAAADLDKAVPIMVNAKCQRPGVCNAAETLLVHRDVAARVPAPRRRRAEAARRRARGRQGRRRPARRSDLEARQQDALRDGVPGAQARGARRRLVDEAIEHITTTARATPRRSSPRTRRCPAVHGRGRRRVRVRERLDALHRRRRVRARRGDGHLHAEAARARAHRSAGADVRQVRAVRRRAGARPSAVREARPRLGVIGGSFDPPHLGHLAIASEAARCSVSSACSSCRLPRHRTRTSKAYGAADVRLQMTALAVTDDARFAASDSRSSAACVHARHR